jgi:molybdopterin converting factor small subunit
MLSKRGDIRVKVKLFASLLRETGIENYDPKEGMVLEIPFGSRIRNVFKKLGISGSRTMICFLNGERAGPWKRIEGGDEISLFRPVAGG